MVSQVSVPRTPAPTIARGESITLTQGSTPAATAPSPRTPSLSATSVDKPEFMTPPLNDSARLDAHHGNNPVRYRNINNVLSDEAALGFATCVLDDGELHLANLGEPNSFAEAERYQAWRAAMCEEKKAVEENGTWELVDLSREHQPIGLKWVFKLKKDDSCAVVKHKARLVAKG